MSVDPGPSFSRPGASIIYDAFLDYLVEFRRLTLKARERFERRAWSAARRDSIARLGLYRSVVRSAVAGLKRELGDQVHEKSLWRQIKSDYCRCIQKRGDVDVAETFFNSVTRQIFTTVGVDPEIEFVHSLSWRPEGDSHASVTDSFMRNGSLEELIEQILMRYRFSVGYEDLQRDAALVAREIAAYAPRVGVKSIELVRSVLFRNKGAYIVGRIHSGETTLPLVLALLNVEGQVSVDAVLLAEHEVSIVFSFTHSYFLVAAERPSALVNFLHSIMPHKPLHELYNSIGYNKHGKTELYRSLRSHLERTSDRFAFAPGERGMVMIVFCMPSFGSVFKVIRDSFADPKNTTRGQVMEKYQLVFRHDRAGRLVDAAEFEHLRFERSQFEPDLLQELLTSASETVRIEEDSVVIRHLYVERRLRPFDLYLREVDEESARRAVLDYGQALRDLAATNIFPGDLLLKNFGVTRNERLVFYDYDELILLSDCNFRPLPEAQALEEEVAGEAWFYVGERDIFPEEFITFLGLRGTLLEAFVRAHADLLGLDYWVQMQENHARDNILDVFPYDESRRLGSPMHVVGPPESRSRDRRA